MNAVLELAEKAWRGEPVPEYHRGEAARAGIAEVAEGVGMWPGFGNAFCIRSERGPVLFDTGSAMSAEALHAAVRAYDGRPLRFAVYSHGHVDHVFGVGPFDAEADAAGLPRPVVVAHEAVAARFDRYARTAGYNEVVNRRQFGSSDLRWPRSYRYPDQTYRDSMELHLGDAALRLFHAEGETDDHTWAYLPERRTLLTGDLFVWVAPNAGNPQKVQRYPAEWAEALRAMAATGAEVLLPGHGLPVIGADRVRTALTETAEFLESLVEQTLALMNSGARLDEAVHAVAPPAHLADRPYLRPVYDEPEFVVRNVWRLYGGWYDGDPSHLKPAPAGRLAAALAELCGGAAALSARARTAAEQGDLRLAGHLAELAVQAAPDDAGAHEARAEVNLARVAAERSTMAQGVFRWAAAESRAAQSGAETVEELQRPGGSLFRIGV
ncbi:alkyl sulfatase dimerization domain-containing protein [Nocardiopsis potens]|uniref:alkyl sulfatase dimerization domain-containing protein n=1 Tax=Nocardiopsis potens TaxID=1246458 RepID=UPI00034C4620|nr:alkyl sulfatase dimerization domain-containing protein [Nocardiopsis potens]